MLITRLITFFEDVLKPPYLQCFFAYRIIRFRSAALGECASNSYKSRVWSIFFIDV